MPTSNQHLEPTPFEPATPVVDSPGGRDAAHRAATRRWLLPALAVLLTLAALVVFWLPQQVSPDRAISVPSPTAERPADSSVTAIGDAAQSPTQASGDTSPWSEAQLTQLRKQARDVLTEMLELQFSMQEHAVEQWAPQKYAAITATAREGDDLYSLRDYPPAQQLYQSALDALRALEAQLPEVYAQQLELIEQRLQQGLPGEAQQALETAFAVDPTGAGMAELQSRIDSLPQLLSLLEQAETAEREDRLGEAQQLLQQATEVDPAHLHARQELQRVAAAFRQQRFTAAMSTGYTALAKNDFSGARSGFRGAAKLRDDSAEARDALLQVEAAETEYKLNHLRVRALSSEQGEKWQDAVAAYQEAHKLDASVLYAREGLARSTTRALLDSQLRASIDQPDRLADVAVAAAAVKQLQQAKEISLRGPVLTEQITQLETLLERANTTVPVTLHSDAQTNVVVYKVARLGRFQQYRLDLRPGTYTAVGSREGFRDVRRQFTVSHDGAATSVSVICSEPI